MDVTNAASWFHLSSSKSSGMDSANGASSANVAARHPITLTRLARVSVPLRPSAIMMFPRVWAAMMGNACGFPTPVSNHTISYFSATATNLRQICSVYVLPT